jgi:hypothetical protein
MHKNSIVNVLGCILILLVVSACGPRELPIEISTKPVERPTLTLPTPDRIITRPVDWIIITENNYEEVFARLRREGRSIVLFGLTDKGYENLALNLNDIRTFIQQQRAIIVAYEQYYQESQSVISNAVVLQ